MSTTLRQAVVLTAANIKSLPRRIWISASMIASVALVVIVLIGFLAMAAGFERTLEQAGSDKVAVILGPGARDERGSEIGAALAQALAAAPEIEIGAEGKPLISRELVVAVDAPRQNTGALETVALRGMDTVGVTLREGISLTAGRMFTPGAAELIVGDGVSGRFAGLAIGNTIRFGSSDWTVVGSFNAGGSAFGSEIWADIGAVQALFDLQGKVQTLRAAVSGPEAVTTLSERLNADATTEATIVSERDFFAAQSGRVARLIRLFGWPVAILMAIGATAGALNTMLSSVSDRATEIATLRTVGFSRLAAFVSTWIEAVLLTLVGAALGAVISVLVYSGWQTATSGGNAAQITFALSVTPGVMLKAGLLALMIGLIGGALPAIRAARMPLTSAMQMRG